MGEDSYSPEGSPENTQGNLKLEQLSKSPEYRDSSILYKMRQQKGRPHAVCTDVDGTWIRHIELSQEERQSLSSQELDLRQEEINRLNDNYFAATARNKQFLDEKGEPIIAITGRDHQDLIDLREKLGTIADFDALVGSQGGEIFVRQKDGTYKQDEEHKSLIEKFDRNKIHEALKQFMVDSAQKLSFMPRDTDENIALYEKDAQAKQHGLTTVDKPLPYKVLCSFSGNQQEAESLKTNLEKTLVSKDCSPFSVVIVGSSGRMDLWDIEIVPMDKLGAVQYLVEQTGMDSVVVGDGGNDLSMIRYGGGAGIVVGGAQEYLQREIAAHPVIKKTEHFTKISVSDQSGLESERVLHLPNITNKDQRGPASILDIEKLHHAFMLLRTFSRSGAVV